MAVGEEALGFFGLLGQGVYDSINLLVQKGVEVVPGIAIAIILLFIGYVVALVLKRVAIEVIKYLKIDHFLESHDLPQAVGGISFSVLIGELVKWYVVILFLAQAVSFLSLNVLSDFIQVLVSEVPLVLGAVLLLSLGFYLARYIRHMINKTNYPKKDTLGVLAEVILMYLIVVMALTHIGFNTLILIEAFRIAFTAVVIIMAAIFGIFFALSFKKDIKNFVMEIRKEI
jgi:MFS family permease